MNIYSRAVLSSFVAGNEHIFFRLQRDWAITNIHAATVFLSYVSLYPSLIQIRIYVQIDTAAAGGSIVADDGIFSIQRKDSFTFGQIDAAAGLARRYVARVDVT